MHSGPKPGSPVPGHWAMEAAAELGNLKELDEVLHKHTAEADISCGSSAVFYRAA